MSADQSRAKQIGRDTSHAQWYWTAVAIITVGLWLAPAIPTQDGPIHLYNLALISDLLAGHPERNAAFHLEFSTITNLGFIAMGGAIAKAIPLWAVERFVLSLHVWLLAWFATRWLRVTSRPLFPAAWLALAFALPWSLFMGFYGFQLASDLALLALTVAWSRREQGLWKNSRTAFACGTVVLVFHAIPAVLFAGLAATMQLVGSTRPLAQRLAHALAVALPTLCLVALAISGSETQTPWIWRDWDYVFIYLATLGNFTFAPQLVPCLAITAGWMLLCLPGQPARARDSAWRFALAAGGSLAILHLFLPDVLAGGGYLTGRFSWWIPLLMLPILDTRPTANGVIKRQALPAILAFTSLASTLLSAAPSAMQVTKVIRASEHRQVSGRITAAIFDRKPRSQANLEPLRHVVAWFALEDGLLTTNYQARVPFFPVRLTEASLIAWPDVDINAAWETDWNRLPIDALLAIDASPNDRTELAHDFETVWTGRENRVELWRRRQETIAQP